MSIFRVKKSSDVIPVGTTRVEVTNKKIERFPSLPTSLTELYCSDCTSLRVLPSLLHCVGLTWLNCSNCTSLRELPPFPMGLINLDCFDCISLRELPSLPMGLELLNCSYCASLHKLPSLPDSLKMLICYNCISLRELPPLPVSLKLLGCSGCTSLLYLPTIPTGCEYDGPSLPTEEEYFKQANVKKNRELTEKGIDKKIRGLIGQDPYHILEGYFSFGKTRKSKGKGNPKKKKYSRRKKSR
jgi:hypothetical protein